MLSLMSGTAERLKTCVQCGAILRAGQGACEACGATQPAPGAPRPPREPAPAPGPAPRRWRSVALALAVVGLLAAFAAGLQVLRDKVRGRAARASPAADARSVVPTAHEAAPDAAPDAFDQLAGRGAPRVEVDLQRELESYAVDGTTAEQIFASIDARGPDGPDGKAVGLTRLQSGEYQYARDPDSGRCVVTRLEARLTITLPKLTSPTLPLAIDEKWRDYQRAVSQHEEHHAEIYRSAVDRVAEKLRFEQPFADRSTMEAAFAATWAGEMDVAERENREFHRHEEQGIVQERDSVTRDLRRVDGELEAIAGRMQARAAKYPNLELPPDEYQRHEADRVRYDALLAERAGLIERGLWLH